VLAKPNDMKNLRKELIDFLQYIEDGVTHPALIDKEKFVDLYLSINSKPKGIKCQFSHWQCNKVGDCPYVKNENIICMDMD